MKHCGAISGWDRCPGKSTEQLTVPITTNIETAMMSILWWRRTVCYDQEGGMETRHERDAALIGGFLLLYIPCPSLL